MCTVSVACAVFLVFAVSAVFVVCDLCVTHCAVLVPSCRCTPLRSKAPAERTYRECKGRSYS